MSLFFFTQNRKNEKRLTYAERYLNKMFLLCLLFFGAIAAGMTEVSAYQQPVPTHVRQILVPDQKGISPECLSDGQEVQLLPTASEPDSLQAKYALLMDAENRRVLFEKNGYTEVPMASTTKIMTLLVALEHASPDEVVTVSAYAASMPEVHLGMKKGEQYRLCDLYYSLMLESHNDTAVAIAEHVGGSVDGFADLMNEKAAEIGAVHTHFVTPNGLDAEGHYTTAYDLALIASCALENEAFQEIIQTPAYSFQELNGKRSVSVVNKDLFLTSYEGALGIKTGFTGKAGYCFVGAARRGEKKFVSVVLASGWPPHKAYKWKDTTRLMDYGMNNYEPRQILKKHTVFQAVPVTDSIEQEAVPSYAEDEVTLLLREGEEVTTEAELPDKLQAPVRKHDQIGTLTVRIDGEIYRSLPLYAEEDRRRITFGYVLGQIIRRFIPSTCS